MDFESIADELYSLAPARFTAERDARASEARRSGDKALADSIRKLKRPTQSAWLSNLLVRQHSQQIEELLMLGEEMREAQEALAGPELRQLARRRHAVISALVNEARSVARESGQAMSDQTSAELEATLEAALATPEAARVLRSGRLTTALRHSGFGSLGAGSAWATPPPDAPGPARRPERKAVARNKASRNEPTSHQSARLRSAEQELRETKTAAAAAGRVAKEKAALTARAEAEERRLASEVTKAEHALALLRAKSTQAATRLRQATRAQEASERAFQSAQGRAARAEEALQRLAP